MTCSRPGASMGGCWVEDVVESWGGLEVLEDMVRSWVCRFSQLGVLSRCCCGAMWYLGDAGELNVHMLVDPGWVLGREWHSGD